MQHALSDVAHARDDDLQDLVAALLAAFEDERLLEESFNLRRRYAQLGHPALAEQLRLYLRDQTKRPKARRVAIHMALACKVTDLLDDLVALALDPDEMLPQRISATYAVGDIGDPAHRAHLKPLVFQHDDPDDELKGCALRATWPEHLTTPELLSVLDRPASDLLGAYRRFLASGFVADITPVDLPAALRWARQFTGDNDIRLDFEPIINDLMRRSWEHLEQPDVLHEFALTAVARARDFDGIFTGRTTTGPAEEGPLHDADKRHLVLSALVNLIEPGSDLRLLAMNRLVQPDDMPWLLATLEASPPADHRWWAQLVTFVIDRTNVRQIDQLLTAREQSPELREVLGPWFNAVPLDSPGAESDRASYRRAMELNRQRAQKPVSLSTPRSEIVRKYLDRFAAGDLHAWRQLNLHLAMDEYGWVRNEYDSSFTTFPGWRDATELVRQEIVAAAGKYLVEQTPSPEQIDRSDCAGYCAFRLLLDQAPHQLIALPESVWHKWAPVLAAFPVQSEPDDWEAQKRLIDQAYRIAPEAVTETIRRLITAENQGEHGHISSILGRVETCWDEQLSAALLAHVRTTSLRPVLLNQLLDVLLAHGSDGARAYAEELLEKRDTPDGREVAIVAAAELLRHPIAGNWASTWATTTQDESFADAVLQWIVYEDRHTNRVKAALSESELASAYVWLAHHYPHDQDGPRSGVMDFRWAVADWRDAFLRALEARGTPEACAAIERIMQELPQLIELLKWSLYEAKHMTRLRTWSPPSADEMLRLASSADTRLVQSESELLGLVLESLDRFQQRLQTNEPPLAPYLWDEYAKRPKDEQRLSDLIKIHLDLDIRDRMVVVNREVENRRGEETDIRVDAIKESPGSDEPVTISLVIEVKGNWHPKLKTAMETQLVERYMRDNHTHCGLYVVGWYSCDFWTDEDSGKRKAPKKHIDAARRLFDEQAEKLSNHSQTVRAVVLDTSMK